MRRIQPVIFLLVLLTGLPLQAGSLTVQVADSKHESLADARRRSTP